MFFFEEYSDGSDSGFFLNNMDYWDYCLELAVRKLSRHESIETVADRIDTINAYENLAYLAPPRDIDILDDHQVTAEDRAAAVKMLLDGKVFFEHAVAGEATRLGLGTKYMINIKTQLTLGNIAEMIQREAGVGLTDSRALQTLGRDLADLLPLSLGARHMLQLSFELTALAKRHKRSPKAVLARQKMIVILNEATAEEIIQDFKRNRFFGFKQDNVYFMIQRAYHGIDLRGDTAFYNRRTPKRLHNHGQIAIQQTYGGQIFSLKPSGDRTYLSTRDYGCLLSSMADKITYNIEDLNCLSAALDIDGIAFALKKGDAGFRMVMEVLKNNPLCPQKGGMAAYDEILGRNVMIESFQLNGLPNNRIEFLNKNLNHYPHPYDAWDAVRRNGLNMHLAVKHDHIYFQPIQGDINHLVDTAFFMRMPQEHIKAWKSPATTLLAVEYMRRQDRQPGFRAFVEGFGLQDV